MFKSNLYTNFAFLLAINFAATTATFAQSHNWNTQARTQAENSNSRAISILTKGPKDKNWLDSAIAALLRGTTSDPTDPVPFTTLGLALDLKQRYSEGLDALNKSYQLEPKSKETLLSIAITNYLTRSYKKSEDVLMNLLRQFPTFCDAHINLGYVYIRLGDFPKAIQSFRKAISCNPNCQPAYQGLAMAHYLTGNLNDAYAEAQHAETLKSYKPVALLLAEISALRGDEVAMKAALRASSKFKEPLEQRPMAMIGFSAQHDFRWDPYLLDNYDKSSFINARSLDLPTEEKKRVSLASDSQINNLLADIKQAVNNSTPDYYLYRQAGLLAFAGGNYALAADLFNKATRACPQDIIDFLYMARALWLVDHKPEAIQCAKWFVDHSPKQNLSEVYGPLIQAASTVSTSDQAQPQPSTQTLPGDAGF